MTDTAGRPAVSSFDNLIPYVSQALGLSPEALERAYRPATEADLASILALRQRVNGSTWWDDEAFVRWRYLTPKLEDGTAPYWVFVRAGEIVGACGLEPVVLSVDGKVAHAVRSLDIMVRPDIDGRGLGAFMNMMLFRRFPIMIVTGSNQGSHRLLSRMFGHATDLVFWKALIRSRELLAERLPEGPLLHMAAAGADVVLALSRRIGRIWAPARMDIRPIHRFDAQATDLSMSCEGLGRVIVRRSAEYLNWRFFDNPRCRYKAYGAFRGGRLRGYVVTRLNVNRPNPRREGDIVDWLVASDASSESPLPALIAAGLDELVQAGAGLVTYAGFGGDVGRAMKSCGLHFRPGQTIPFFVRAGSPEVHARLASGTGWFLTRGDLDVE